MFLGFKVRNSRTRYTGHNNTPKKYTKMMQWRAEGVRTVRRPRASTLGASKGSFFVKKSREMAKNEEQMSLPGHNEAREGASRERIVINLTTDKKGRQKFGGTNIKYFRGHPRTSLAPGIQQPLHATEMMS